MATIYTIGHSTRGADELIDLLREHGVTRLVDVRRFPTSRRHPHFSRDPLAAALEGVGIDYAHEGDLGGYRTPRQDSPNTAWRARGFQAYADHMETEGFRAALERLEEAAERAPTAIMCAEAVPWRCHRQLIADALVARGHRVIHIIGPDRAESHELADHARVLDDGRIVYPAPSDDQYDLL